MRIAITGANGFVGARLCQYLAASEKSVLAITRSDFKQAGIDNLVISELTSSQLSEHLKQVDCLIHLAARTHHNDARDAWALYRKDNVEISSHVAQAASQAGVKRFIYMSSIKVNGEESTEPFKSQDIPEPIDAYGTSKWETEKVLHEILSSTATELVIIRPPLIWGDHPKGNLQTLSKLIDLGVPLPFKNIQNRRDLVSLENLCSLIEKTLTHPNAAGGTFLVSDDNPLSLPDIIRLLARNNSKEPRLFGVPNTLFRYLGDIPALSTRIKKLTGNLEVDISETKKKLDWAPNRTTP